jgi:hypothetical protein
MSNLHAAFRSDSLQTTDEVRYTYLMSFADTVYQISFFYCVINSTLVDSIYNSDVSVTLLCFILARSQL